MRKNKALNRILAVFLASVLLLGNGSFAAVASDVITAETGADEAYAPSSDDMITADSGTDNALPEEDYITEDTAETDPSYEGTYEEGAPLGSPVSPSSEEVITSDQAAANTLPADAITAESQQPSATEEQAASEPADASQEQTESLPETLKEEETPTGEHIFKGEDNIFTEEMTGMDFSTARLIVGIDESKILDPEHIVSSYNGVYLLQYSSPEQARYAYVYYHAIADIVSPDAVVEAQTETETILADDEAASEPSADETITADEGMDNMEGEQSGDLTDTESSSLDNTNTASDETEAVTDETEPLTEETASAQAGEGADTVQPSATEAIADYVTDENSDPFTELSTQLEIDETAPSATEETSAEEEAAPHPLIALIDTGVSEGEHIVDRVSMLGEDPSDDNGHGDLMAGYILQEDPDARILSIKALDSEGKGGIASVYAAMEYAIAKDAKIINLSLSAYSTEENSVLKDIVDRASAAGISVVGAAGNDGAPVKYFTPGNIESALVIGACNEDGSINSISNFGETVDYYVPAGNTSEAAARFTGFLSSGNTDRAIGNIFHMEEDGLVPVTVDQSGMFTGTAYTYNRKHCINYLDDWVYRYIAGTGTTISAPSDASIPPGFHFDHVNTSNNHSYTPSQLPVTITANITASYKYQMNYLNYTFDSGVAGVATNNTNGRVSIRTASEAYKTFKNPGARTGYTFLGWYDGNTKRTGTGYTSDGTAFDNELKACGQSTASNTNTPYNNMKAVLNACVNSLKAGSGYDIGTSSKTVNLVAKWSANTYTVEYHANGATGGSTASSSHTYNVAKKLTANGYTRTGYTFAGWNTKEDGTGTNYSNQQNVTNLSSTNGAVINLFAKWTPITYSITYDLDGGTQAHRNNETLDNGAFTYVYNPTTVKYDNSQYTVNPGKQRNGYFQIERPTRTGYRFTGWNITGMDTTTHQYYYDGAGHTFNTSSWNQVISSSMTSIPQAYAHLRASDGTVSFKAKWEPITYKVKYNANGGSGTMSEQVMTYNTRNPLTPNAFTKGDEYVFGGWATSQADADAGKRAYKDGVSVRNLTTTNDATINLYAIWMKKPKGTFVDEETEFPAVLTVDEHNKGKFLIRETKSAPGYILDRNPQYIDLSDAEPGSTQEATFENVPNHFTIMKIDADTGNVIENEVATFHIWKEGGTAKEDMTLPTTNGKIELSVLGPGTWHFQETEAPTGYTLIPTTFTFVVNDDGTINGDGVIKVPNMTSPHFFMIQKQDQNGKPLEGVTFTFSKSVKNMDTGRTATSHTTNSSGMIIIDVSGMSGVCTYAESAVPEGIILDTSLGGSFTVTSNKVTAATTTGSVTKWSDNSGATVTDQVNSARLKKEDTNGNPIPGVVFKVWHETDEAHAVQLVTDASGYTDPKKLEKLSSGTWHYEEVEVPAGYMLTDSSSGTFVVGSDHKINGAVQATITATNTPISVDFIKKDASTGRNLAGAKIRLRNVNGIFDQTVTTGSNGIAHFEPVPVGSYEATEVEAPPGYTKSDDVIKFTLDENGRKTVTSGNENFTFNDDKITIELLKIDAETGAPISGVKFNIDGTVYTTNRNGLITFPDTLSYGNHTIKESERPEGYILDKKEHVFTLDPSGRVSSTDPALAVSQDGTRITMTLMNQPWEKGSLIVYKESTDGERLSGAEFTLSKKSGSSYSPVGTLTEDPENPGTYTMDELDIGEYKVDETRGPVKDGIPYIANFSKEFAITEADSAKVFSYTAINEQNHPYIKKVNENNEPIAHAVFEVWKDGGEDAKETWETDAQGLADLGPREVGTWFYEEKSVPLPYLLPANDAIRKGSFTVNADGTINAGHVTTLEIKVTNKKQRKLKVVVNKTGKGNALSGCAFVLQEWSEAEGLYLEEPDEDTNQTIALTETAPGRYESDYVVNTYNNKGKFRLVETKAPEGFAPALVEEVTIDEDGPLTQEFTKTFDDPPTELTVKKVSTEDENTVIAGVTFKIERHAYISEEAAVALKDDPSEALSVDDMIEFSGPVLQTVTGTTNAAGIIEKEELKSIPAGVYVVTETATVPGYTLNPEKIIVILDEDGFFHRFDAQDEEEKIRGIMELKVADKPNLLRILKLDGNTREPLAGARFKVWHESQTEASVSTLTSNADGEILKGQLQPGKWTVKEIQAPPGYPNNDLPVRTFRVDNDGYIVIKNTSGERREAEYTMTIINFIQPPSGQVTIEKINVENPSQRLHGAKFVIYEYDGANDEWVKYDQAGYRYDEATPYTMMAEQEEGGRKNGFYASKANALKFTGNNGGRFKVVEEQAPPGYTYAKELSEELGYEVKWEWEFNICDVQDVHFTDEMAVPNEAVGLPLKKIDADTGALLNDVYFTVWNTVDGEDHPITVVTGYDADGNPGEEGIGIIPELKPGATYHVTETEIRGDNAGKYFVDPRTRIFTVSTSGEISDMTFENGDDGTIALTSDGIFEIPNTEFKRLIEVKVDKQDEADSSIKIGPDNRFNNEARRQCLFQAFEWNKATNSYSTTPYRMVYNSALYKGSSTDFKWDATAKKYVSGMLKITTQNEGKFRIREVHARKGYVGNWSKDITVAADGTTLHVLDETATNKKQEVTTEARDSVTQSHLGTIAHEAHIIDKVTWKNLEEGKTYHIVGKLYDKHAVPFIESTDGAFNGFLQDANGEITAETTITIGAAKPGGGTYGTNDSVELEFTLDSFALEGRKIVVYEYIWDKAEGTNNDEDIIASHEDPDAEEQIIYYPFAVSLMTGGKGNRIYYMLMLAFLFAAGTMAVLWTRRRKRIN